MGIRVPHTYYRDLWILGPGVSNGCPGAFPSGFIPRIRKMRWWGTRRLWLCAGGFKDPGGIGIDIRLEVRPTILGDATRLPIADSTFDFVLADPPYSEEEARKLYGTGYPSGVKMAQEAFRVLKPEGLFLLLHRMTFGQTESRIPPMMLVGLVGIVKDVRWGNIRVLTVLRKQHTLQYSKEDC